MRDRRTLQEIADVVARAEDCHVALDHHHPHSCIALGGLQCVGQLGVHVGGDGVFLVHAVEGDGGDTVLLVDQDVLGRRAHG
ncbi:hypothetical protein SDC9_128033 [bioreactor metagenome]|uniref:Uncharacterized protein n=1 Tax=bioreactor metagenome TaxID=1076179 RepID=A0A645CWA8_9ZZZZ